MAETCYRHPDRETRVSCSSCGRPICPDCMTPTPVGMRCPECMQQRTKVVQGVGGEATGFWQAPATFILIGLNVIAYLIEITAGVGGLNNPGGEIVIKYALFGPSVAEGEWYRLITSGFLHANLVHIGFNMLLLFFLGRLLEPALGTPRFVALYFASLLAGSLGVMVLEPNALTLGASGAVYGLAGATFVIARGRGMDAIAGQIGFLIVINLLFSFTISGVSIGAHLGGLVGGVLCAMAIVAGERGYFGPRHFQAGLAIMILIGIVSFVAALAIA
ncbi:MAG TPA: rhomboid family intramembrane serine protease [Solirubrobacterales bacterium]|nr:rhomboid family intramembrane serine protease [Solirubrobacterales bacterium]